MIEKTLKKVYDKFSNYLYDIYSLSDLFFKTVSEYQNIRKYC